MGAELAVYESCKNANIWLGKRMCKARSGLIGGGVEKGETIEESIVREVKEETGLTIMPDKIIHQATTFFKRNAEAQANQSIQLYFTHSQLHGQINNDNITDSEKTYTNGTPEWVDLDKIDDINFRHSVSLRTILGAYGEGKWQ